MSSIIKADGQFTEFFSRPIADTLGVLVLIIWTLPLLRFLLRILRGNEGHLPT